MCLRQAVRPGNDDEGAFPEIFLAVVVAHVDLAGDGSGDEGRAAFLEQFDGSFRFGDERAEASQLYVNVIHDLPLFTDRWACEPKRDDVRHINRIMG